MRSILLAAVACGAFLMVQNAQAALLSYEFRGVANGGTLSTPMGPVDLTGAEYRVTGNTLNDIDLYPSLSVGEFAATSTYDFGILGSFTTDAGADYYFQDYGTVSEINGSGLADLPIVFGFAAIFTPSFPGDPDAGGIASGLHVPINTLNSPRSFSNSLGQTMSLSFGSINYMNITEASAVPEPASLLSFAGLGLCFAVGAWRKRRRQA